MPTLISHSCQANKDVVCRFASCRSGSAADHPTNDHPLQLRLIESVPKMDLIRGKNISDARVMHAGPAHTVSAEEGGWVTSETAAGQNFIGNQYFVFSSSLTSVQVLSEVLKNTKFGRLCKSICAIYTTLKRY